MNKPALIAETDTPHVAMWRIDDVTALYCKQTERWLYQQDEFIDDLDDWICHDIASNDPLARQFSNYALVS